MSVKSLDFEPEGKDAAGGLTFQPVTTRQAKTVRGVGHVSQGANAKVMQISASLKSPSLVQAQTRRKKDFISAFDDKFQVDLHAEHSPSISGISQRNVKFVEKAGKLKGKIIAVIILILLFFFVLINLLIDFKFLNTSTNLFCQYVNDLPFLLLLGSIYMYISSVGLKIFKHN